MYISRFNRLIIAFPTCFSVIALPVFCIAQTSQDISHAKPVKPAAGATKGVRPRSEIGTKTDPSKIFGSTPAGSPIPKFSLDKLPKGSKPMPPFAPGLAITPGMDARQTATETDVATMKRLLERMAKRVDDMNNQLKMLEARVTQSELDTKVRPLESRATELKATLESLMKTYTIGHPRVVETRKQLEELEGQITAAKSTKKA